MSIADRMRSVVVPGPTIVWKGPEVDGVTQSLIGRALNCWERFRVYAVEGLQTVRKFSHRIEYGSMFHACEESHAAGESWQDALEGYCEKLCDEYPLSRADIGKWFMVCRTQFPVYLDHWRTHPEQVARTSLLQEQVFDVPYRLPSGRTVRLRGKWDGISNMDAGLWVDEAKTKGDVDREQIERNLTFDLQTILYTVALRETAAHDKGPVGLRLRDNGKLRPIKGVRYNVVRRPLSGGEGDIKQKQATDGAKCPKCKGVGYTVTTVQTACPKCEGRGRIGGKPAESDAEFYGRLRGVITGTGLNSKGENYTGPSAYFYRWTTEITAADVERFEARFLRPFLEYLCDWYDEVTGLPRYSKGTYRTPLNWTRPFGVPNYLDEAGFSDYDAYLSNGSQVGLTRVKTLFRELEE